MTGSNGSTEVFRLIRGVIAGRTYGLDMRQVRSIQRQEQLQGPADIPGAVGWIQSGEEKIPVFDMAARFKQERDHGGRTGKIVVLQTPTCSLGVLVEQVESVIEVPMSDVCALPTLARNSQADFFAGVVTYKEDLLLILYPEGLLPDTIARVPTSLPEVVPDTGLNAAAGANRQGRVVLFAAQSGLATEETIVFGLSLTQVPQILHDPHIVSIPGTRSDVLGLVEWRGAPLAVIDLPARMGGQVVPRAGGGRLLLVRAPAKKSLVGIPVRPQVRIRSLPLAYRASTRPVPLQASLIRGMFELANATLVIPDMDRLLEAASVSSGM